MKATETNLKDCFVLEPTIFNDNRGYFYESFNKNKFKDLTGIDTEFVQDNESYSTKGVLRGIHFQTGEFAQAKLVRVIEGEVLDVAIDLRRNSPTFGKHFAIRLSDENKMQLFIPRGFGHAFVVLSDTCRFSYKCDNFYNKASEGGIIYSDSELAIDWILPKDELLVSEKDIILPNFNKSTFNLF